MSFVFTRLCAPGAQTSLTRKHRYCHPFIVRVATGCEPYRIDIPKRFLVTVNWKGAIDASYLDNLKSEYSRRILQFKG
ncbi:hypothetical protein TRIP_B40253 [uncultured Desulfatiglans sp.]|nr:hypothetical protein TRIP_B40253 [uncultured Desulfatiglans sp.]